MLVLVYHSFWLAKVTNYFVTSKLFNKKGGTRWSPTFISLKDSQLFLNELDYVEYIFARKNLSKLSSSLTSECISYRS